jgi:hypothetical protein
MNKEGISPIILAAVNLMKKVNEGLEVEFLSGMRRVAIGKDENGLLSPLGVNSKMTYLGIEKNVFIGCQHCDVMLNPLGHILAEEMIMDIFKGEILKKYNEQTR